MKRKLLASLISLGLLAAVLAGPQSTSQLIPAARCQDCQTVIRVCVDTSSGLYLLCRAIPGTSPQQCDEERRRNYDSCVKGAGCDPSNPPPIKITMPETPILPPYAGVRRAAGPYNS